MHLVVAYPLLIDFLGKQMQNVSRLTSKQRWSFWDASLEWPKYLTFLKKKIFLNKATNHLWREYELFGDCKVGLSWSMKDLVLKPICHSFYVLWNGSGMPFWFYQLLSLHVLAEQSLLVLPVSTSWWLVLLLCLASVLTVH